MLITYSIPKRMTHAKKHYVVSSKQEYLVNLTIIHTICEGSLRGILEIIRECVKRS